MILAISNVLLHRRITTLEGIRIRYSCYILLILPSTPYRHEQGFNRVKIPGSSRSAFVIKVVDNNAWISLSQPSDCVFLQREECSQVTDLTVYFDDGFTYDVNEPVEQQPHDTWKEALHYLLNTYRPKWCDMHTGNTDTGIENCHEVQLADGTTYGAHWNETHSVLFIIK